MLEATRTPGAVAGRPDALLKALTRDVPLFLLSPTAAKTALVQARAAAAQYVPSSVQGAQAARVVQAATHAVVAEAAHAMARSHGAGPQRAVAAAHAAVAQVAHTAARQAGKSHPEAVAAARSAVAQVAHDAARKAGASPKAAIEAGHAAVAKATHDAARRVGKTPAAAVAAARSAVSQVAHTAARKGGATLKAAAAVAKDEVKKAEKVIVKEATSALKKGASSAGKAVAKEAEKQFGSAVKKIGVDQAHKLVGEAFKNMKLPGNLPVVFPRELTAEGVANAAYATGKKYTEDLIQSKIGIPISLPKSLSVKEISRSVASLIPTDLSSALDMGLAVGAQVASAALTSALVGAGVGSVIPGLGTVVGIGVALGVAALKDALKSPPPPYERPCPTPSGFRCPKPGNRSPMEILPWLAAEQERISKLISEAQAQSYCGRGELVDCDIYLSMLAQKVIGLINGTPEVLGLPQLERLIPLYEKAPTARYYFDPKTRKTTHSKPQPGYSQQGYAGGYMLFGKPSSKNALGFVTPGVQAVLPAMKARRVYLIKLLADAEKISRSNAEDLRRRLATELGNATLQYQFDPSSENKNWFIRLSVIFEKLQKFEDATAARAERENVAGRKLEKTRMTGAHSEAWKLRAERESVFLQCSDGLCPTPALAKRYKELKAMPESAFKT
jgi:hypothetical protein